MEKKVKSPISTDAYIVTEKGIKSTTSRKLTSYTFEEILTALENSYNSEVIVSMANSLISADKRPTGGITHKNYNYPDNPALNNTVGRNLTSQISKILEAKGYSISFSDLTEP